MSAYSAARVIGALRRRRNDLLRQAMYRPNDNATLRNAVLFEAFDGKVIADSPLDIFNELQRTRPDLEFIWTIKKSAAKEDLTAPAGSRAVIYGSRAWLHALATSKYLVNNSAFPWYFKKVRGQIYLQTWHGTPLKRLVRDIDSSKLSTQYLSTMMREAAAWDFLISPSEYATAAFKTAFGYPTTHGEILEVGYPRNDRLVGATSEVRDRVRRQLGVKPATQFVLYAPTWREYNRTALGDHQSINYIDENTKLPKGFQLAYRGHSMTLNAHNSATHTSTAAKAIDVTHYPDITELFLAADVLITDYSSVMFDFAITGKPMIFLAPDIEKYEGERGFYFDFRAEAPGPICHTTAEVIRALADINAVAKTHAKAYKAWQQKFVGLDDGKAAARVVARVFGR